MVGPPRASSFSEMDRQVFECLVPADHYLRRVAQRIDFERFRQVVAGSYSPDRGRPSEDVVLLVKLEFLQYHDNLSDRQVIERGKTDVAYRYFLGLALTDHLPDYSTLCYFRGRLGTEGHRALFQELVRAAREQGLVKDRLRLKDATHVMANVALPTTLVLVAQMRNKLLAAARPYDPSRVEGEIARAEALRASTDTYADEERLVARVTHVREILAWVDELPSPADVQEAAWQQLLAARRLAHKILDDQRHPEAGDRTRSVHDPDARRGKHGTFYDGYLLDVAMDADSELITAVDVLPANGDEGADAAELIRQEQSAQGNQVASLSIDGAGFHGPLLRELTDPQGLQVDVYVPPKTEPASATFGPEQFVEDARRGVVTCPAGQTSQYRQADAKGHATLYRFRRDTCAACPLRSQCLQKEPREPGPFGRTVRKNLYEKEYQRVRAKALTAEYAAVRREHPKIERKLSELINRHAARRARYRGQPKVLCQALWTALTTNVKRIVRLLNAQTPVLGQT
jgi:transposase